MVVRVLDRSPEDVWKARYELINDFESQLAHRATTIVKLFLHISKDEQRLRLQKRIDNPAKRWKSTTTTLRSAARDDYMAAYEDALVKTSTDAAQWYVRSRRPQVVPQLGGQPDPRDPRCGAGPELSPRAEDLPLEIE